MEVGQVSLFALVLSTSVRSCTFVINISLAKASDYEKNARRSVLSSNAFLDGQEKIS